MRRSGRKFGGKVILITGATSGIGRQTAIDFAAEGARVLIIVARSLSKLTELANIIGKGVEPSNIHVVPYLCDVSNKRDVDEVAAKVITQFGYIDILINNAGVGVYGNVANQTIEDIETVMRTNYFGTAYFTKAFLGHMLKRNSGHIVNVASVAGSFGIAGLAGYCASKFAVLGFSESLHQELVGTGVQVTVVSPIGVRTKFFNHESFGTRKPFSDAFLLQPNTVSRAILKASGSSRLEIIVPFYVRSAVWLKQTFPYLLNPIVGRLLRRQMTNTSDGAEDTI